MIKKILLIIGLIVLSMMSYAQSAVQQADRAFAEGNYSDAVQLYEMVASTIVGDETERTKLYNSANKCREIISLHTQADNAYDKKKYADAKKLYQSILKYNSSDKLASQRVSECNKQISLAASNKQQKKDYSDAIKNGSNGTLLSYVKKYPKSSESELFSFIVNEYYKELNKSHVKKYIQAADMFADGGNRSKAIEWYDKAIALADAEAMYKKAMLYDNVNHNEYKILLGMSHAGGYKPASDKVKNFKATSLQASKRLYDNLCKYETDLYAFVYVYVNRSLYPTQELDVESYVLKHPYLSNPTLTYKEDQMFRLYNDNLIYQYAKIVEGKSKKHSKMMTMMEIAASQGNVDAVKWIYNNASNLSNDEKKEMELYMIIYDVNTYNDPVYRQDMKEGYEAFLKYLKGQQLTYREWSKINWIDNYLDAHVELMSRAYGRVYSNSSFKSFKSLLESRDKWDKDVVDDIKKNAHKYNSDKYANKIIKKLSKVRAYYGVYDKTRCLTYRMLDAGYCSNIHSYKVHVGIEYVSW